ncbi:ABC transporter ATP-binding protein [Vibrio sp. ABG19]|nr:ABC transporter ATP-binding protein [Vibrio sp. ABG19]
MHNSSPVLAIEDLTVRYAQQPQPTLHRLSLELGVGQWNCILGQSGCGKTTLLKYLAGLLPAECEISGGLQAQAGSGLSGNIAYMAQQDLLLPWLSVLDNVCLAARLKNQACRQVITKAKHLLELVGLTSAIHHKPGQLSGGMRQRVALARTLLQDKPVVLMDEPFSALDAVTRHQLQQLSHQLLAGKTVVLITHDPAEACRLAERLFILEKSLDKNAARLESLDLPVTPAPRDYDQATTELHNQIFARLGARHA